MPKSTTFCNNILDLFLNGVAIADLAENDSSSPLTNTYVALYTGTMGVTDDPTVNEATYGGYARKARARGAFAGWAAASGGISGIVAELLFDQCASGTNIITHVKIVTTASGAGKVLWAGELAAPRTVTVGVVPRWLANALKVKET